MKELRMLLLDGNNLSDLPKELGDLPNLEIIRLSINRFWEFPKAILSIRKLVQLDLSSNSIEALPDDLYSLTALKSLALSQNRISYISPKISNLRLLYHFDISNNLVTALPFDDSWSSLPEDRFVNVVFYGNPLLPFPPERFGMSVTEDFWDFRWMMYFSKIRELGGAL
jgi:Leucine-rich repeat (LRR) protein